MIQSGQLYRVKGIPGQRRPGCRIEIGSMTNTCQINARVYFDPPDDDEFGLLTIGSADFYTALRERWIELET